MKKNTQINTLKAAAVKVDITNPNPETRLNDPHFARILVLDDGETRILLLTMDVTAIAARTISDQMLPDVADDFMHKLRNRLKDECAIAADNIIVNASHTHPPGNMLCSDSEQLERILAAVKKAISQLSPAKIGYASGIEKRIAMNRTLRLKDGSHWSIRHSIPSPPPEQVAGAGPLDRSLGILRIDHLDGSPLALVFNFACHLLFANYDAALGANFPGYAAKLIEEKLGNNAPAMFLQGAAGDVCDVGFKKFNKIRDIKILGEYLAETSLNIYEKIETKAVKLKAVRKKMCLPRRKDIPELLEQLEKQQKELLESLRFTTLNFELFLPLYLQSKEEKIDFADAAEEASYKKMREFNQTLVDKYLQSLRSMEALSKNIDDIETLKKHALINENAGGKDIETEVTALQIGECLIVALPFEALTQIGLNIKNASPFEHTFIAAFSNGYMHYGAPEKDYNKGGYEVTECLLDKKWEKIFEKNIKEIFEEVCGFAEL